MGLTRFGAHIIDWNDDVLNFVGRIKPAIIKVVGPFGHNTEYLKEAKRRSPDSKWLFRLYRDNQPLEAPSYHAEVHARLMESYVEHYDIFEGYNEIDPRDHSKDPPGPLDIEIIKRYNEFDARLANIVNLEWGKKYCALNWSNGQPPPEAWKYLLDALNRADYIGLHNYGWETLPDYPQFALRHREIFDLLPVKKLMILSEVGMTNAVFGGPDLGWKSWDLLPALFAKERRAAAVWAWFLDRINEDPYVVGVNAYTTGRLQGDNWGTHDFTPRLYKLVGDYILGHPSPDPYLPNGGNPMDVWKNVPPEIAQWRKVIEEVTSSYHVPIPSVNNVHVSPAKLLACMIMKESNGDQFAINAESGAAGLLQIMPFHFDGGQDPYEPHWNVKRGLEILEAKLSLAPGDLQKALFYYSGRLNRPWEPFIEKYWNYIVEKYKEFWGIDLEPLSAPDWEAKYKYLEGKVDSVYEDIGSIIAALEKNRRLLE